jgi:DNA-binding HxlR family transcriptional regulator
MTLTADHTDDSEKRDPLDEAAYVLGSQYRHTVMRRLATGPTTPSTIADGEGIARSHVSRALTELGERDLVESHSGESRTKLYSLTDYGAEIADIVDDIEGGESA